MLAQVSPREKGRPRSSSQEGPYTLTGVSVYWFLVFVFTRQASNCIPDQPEICSDLPAPAFQNARITAVSQHIWLSVTKEKREGHRRSRKEGERGMEAM